jgi:hypothetical protein
MAVVFPGLRFGWDLAADLFLFSAGAAGSLMLTRLDGDGGKKTPKPKELI